MIRVGPRARRVELTVEDGLVVVRATPPGPAGASQLRLAGGAVALAADTAEPENLVSLSYALHDAPVARAVLETVLDLPVLDVLSSATAQASGTGRHEPVELWRPDGAVSGPTVRALRATGLGRVGRSALVAGELARGRADERATGLGLLELAALASPLRKLGPSPDPQALAHAAAGWLRDLDDGWFDDLAPPGVDALAVLVSAWRGALHPVRETRDLLDRLEAVLDVARRGPARGRVASAMAGPLAGAAAGAPLRPDTALAVPALAAGRGEPAAPGTRRTDVAVVLGAGVGEGAVVIGSVLEDNHLTVHVGGLDEPGVWLRVFRAGPAPTVLAMAPFADAGWTRSRTAVALVPARSDPGELLVDVTTVPGSPWRSAATRTTEEAIALGVDAARATRRADPDAAERWERCADAWSAAQDPERSRRAASLARRADGRTPTRTGRPDPVGGALAVDLVAPPGP